MRLLNRRSQNPFPDLVRLFFAPRGMIRRVQPHLENIRHGNPLMSDHRPEHRLLVFRDSNVCVRLSFRVFDRKAELLQGGRVQMLQVDIRSDSMNEYDPEQIGRCKEHNRDARSRHNKSAHPRLWRSQKFCVQPRAA